MKRIWSAGIGWKFPAKLQIGIFDLPTTVFSRLVQSGEPRDGDIGLQREWLTWTLFLEEEFQSWFLKKVWIIPQQCSHIAVEVLVKEVPKIHSLKETTTEM